MNLRPPGYEPDELPTAPLRDVIHLVPETGVEPVRDKLPRDFKSRASANSATPAYPFPTFRVILKNVAPRVGLEPTTYRLTAGCSTIELSRRTNYRLTARVIISTVHDRVKGKTTVFRPPAGDQKSSPKVKPRSFAMASASSKAQSMVSAAWESLERITLPPASRMVSRIAFEGYGVAR